MRISTDEVTDGSLDGERVWICDYRRQDPLKKAQRSVPPTLVEVVSNELLPANKTIYYSESHFRPVSSKGVVLSKVIPLYDNTGYRSYAGIPLNVFDNYEECVAHYNLQVNVVVDTLYEAVEEVTSQLRGAITEVEGLLVRVE